MRSDLRLALHLASTVATAAAVSMAQVRINEVATSDDGLEDREFVELHLGGTQALSLGGWTLRVADAAGSERTLATIPQGTVLPAGGFYVIGGPALPAADLRLPTFDALPNDTAALVLRDASSTPRDSLVLESFRGLSPALAALAEGEGIWGAFQSSDQQPVAWARVRDGYDSQNESDFVLRPATPGSSNTLFSLLPWRTTFDTAPTGSTVSELYGTRGLVRAADPGVSAPWQLQPVVASPQGGRIAVLGEASGESSVVSLLTDGAADQSFDAWVYLDAAALPVGESAAWSIGLRGSSSTEWVPPAVRGTGDLSNGNTGVSWTYLADASGAVLYLLDHNDGGYGTNARSTPRVLAEVVLLPGVNDGWQRLELAAFGPQVYAKVGGAVFGGTTAPALGDFYFAHSARVTNPVRTRWLRFDEPQARSFGDPIPFFVPNPAITPAGAPVQMQDYSLGNPDEYDWSFGNGAGQCCNVNLPPASACTNTPSNATGTACTDPTTTYPTPMGPIPGLHFPTLKVKQTPGPWAPPTAISLVCVYPATENDQAPFLLYLPFNEVRGQVVTNAAGSRAALARMPVIGGPWQSDPQRPGFQGNEPGSGALGAGTSAYVDTGFPTELCGTVVIVWSTLMATPPTQEVAFCGAGPGGTLRITTGGVNGDRLAFSGTSIGRLVSGQNLNAQGQWRNCALVIDNLAGTARFWFDGQPDSTALFFAPGTFREKQGGSFRVGDHDGAPATAHFAIDSFGIEGNASSAQRLALLSAGEPAHWASFGAGCALPQTGATPAISASNAPRIGSPVAVRVQNAPPAAFSLLVIGFGASTFAGTPIALPIPLPAPFGVGCDLLISPDILLGAGAVAPNGQLAFSFPIPLDPLLSGAHAYAQWLFASPQSAIASDALDLALR
ncbi:MAG: lamin tail domain-containing protein [Planctomycetes bacterium]|nr:lamin tail domain-containing protein [Planctomycetota bacterium]